MSAKGPDRGTAGENEPTSGQRLLAASAGLLCHGTFLVAVSAMFLGLQDGLRGGFGARLLHLSGNARLGANVLLALQFPLLHSFLLTQRGRAVLGRVFGTRHGRVLAPTTYAWSAALQILATFTLWSPSGTLWWAPQGGVLLALNASYAAAWLFLGKALLDGGLGLQTGWIGWTALWRGRRVRFPALPEHGLFAVCRQPIYLGFALTLWTGPVWTPDRLLLASIWSAYCLFGPLHKERRYLRQHGETFASYQRRVPYMWPRRMAGCGAGYAALVFGARLCSAVGRNSSLFPTDFVGRGRNGLPAGVSGLPSRSRCSRDRRKPMTMSTNQNQTWAIVLAAGEGKRLRELTSRGGIDTPKQFCSLRGGRSLLGDALARAARIVPRKRVVVVVAEEHRRFWEPELAALAPENVVVQAKNKGTAAGILLPALSVLERDPEARIAFLPSDHFVAREHVLESSLRLALEALDEAEAELTLLGITPDAPETGYGWIVPKRSDRLLRPVERFVEKPAPAVAAELFAAGALWNSFLFAVKGRTLLASFEERLPELVHAFQRVHAGERGQRGAEFAKLYAGLETHDFSRDVLQGSEHRLRLEIVPACGWTDLGTPARVEACLATLRGDPAVFQAPLFQGDRAPLDLALALGEYAGRTAALSA